MHVFWVRQSDLRSVHPACGTGPRVACFLSQVRRLRTYARRDAHVLRTRRKNLLQDGLPQVRTHIHILSLALKISARRILTTEGN